MVLERIEGVPNGFPSYIRTKERTSDAYRRTFPQNAENERMFPVSFIMIAQM